jgi:hypothetical protein
MTPIEMAQIKTEGTSEETKKSVSDLIIDKFQDSLKDNSLFQGITNNLIKAVQEKKIGKKQVEEALQGKHENQTTKN